jgi:hypothetical protein
VDGVAFAEGGSPIAERRRGVRDGSHLLAVELASAGEHGHRQMTGLMQQRCVETRGVRIEQDVGLPRMLLDGVAILHAEAHSGVIAVRYQRHVVIRHTAAGPRDLARVAIEPECALGGFVVQPRGVSGCVGHLAIQRILPGDFRAAGIDLSEGFQEDYVHRGLSPRSSRGEPDEGKDSDWDHMSGFYDSGFGIVPARSLPDSAKQEPYRNAIPRRDAEAQR